MLGTRWPHKPPIGYQIDDEHPLAQGLVFFAPFWEGSGPIARDIISGVPMTFAGTVQWGTATGPGLNLASGYCLALAPPSLQQPGPITIAYGFHALSLPDVNGGLCGLTYTTGNSNPYYGLGFRYYNNSPPAYEVFFNTSNTLRTLGGSGIGPITIGGDYTIAASAEPGAQFVYTNGDLSTTGAIAGTIAYSNPYVYAGGISVFGSKPSGALPYWMAIWDRMLLASEHQAIAANIWQVFEPRRLYVYIGEIAALGAPKYTVTGPSGGITGVASAVFTVAPDLLITSDTITFSDSGQGGTFTPSSLTFTNSAVAQTVTYTPASTGTKSLSFTSADGHTITGSPVSYVSRPVPINFTLTGPSTSVARAASAAFTVTPASTTTDTLTPNDGGHGGTFIPASLPFTASAAPQTFTYTGTAAGSVSITVTSADGGVVTGSPKALTVTAIGFTLTGPATGTGLAASSNFTVTPASATTDTIVFGDASHGGTFVPSSLTFTNSAVPQTVTYTPSSVGPKTLTATSAAGGVITGSPATYIPLPTPGSVQFSNAFYFSTASNSLLNGQTTCTLSFRVQFNTIAGSGVTNLSIINKAGVYPALLGFGVNTSQVSGASIGFAQSSPSYIISNFTFEAGIPNHVVISYSSGAEEALVFVNGNLNGTFALTGTTSAYSGALSIGPEAGVPVSLQISDVAIWHGYAATQTDAINLYSGVYNPLTLPGQAATAWYPMGGTVGATPAYTDIGLQDWSGNGYSMASSAGSTANVVYAGALGFTPPIQTAAYVTKSGKWVFFFPVATVAAPNGYNAPQPVTSVPSNPVITWNGHVGQIGPLAWASSGLNLPWVAYPLEFGGVSSVGIASGGTGMVSPVVTASGGGGSGATFGTPVLAHGVVSYTVVGATGYTSAPAITLSGGTYTTAPSARAVYGSGAFTVVPEVGGIQGCGSGVTVAPTVTATGGGGTYISITANLSYYIQYVPKTAPGSGYTSPPTLTVTDSGGGTGASLVAVMTGPASSDVLTYTASWGWLQCNLGGAPQMPPPGSTVPGSIVNYAGSTEGPAGLLQGFPTARTMKLGVNAGAAQSSFATTNTTFCNYAHRIGVNESAWSVSSGSLVTLVDGTPYSWTVPSATLTIEFYSTNAGYTPNPIDGTGSPSRFGTWIVVYTDPNAGTSNAATVGLIADATVVSGPTTTVSGTTVAIAYDLAYAGQQNIVLRLTYSNPHFSAAGTQWTISNLAVIPPNNTVTESNPLATDQNVVAWVTTPSGNTPWVWRCMDSNWNYGGAANCLDPTDIAPATHLGWGGPRIPSTVPGTTTDAAGNPIPSGTVTWEYYRPYNTNPGDATYGWSSPNIYSSQWGYTGTDSFGPYLALPATDNGRFAAGVSAVPYKSVAVELVSATPHNLRTGQLVIFGSGSTGGISVTGASGPTSLTESSLVVWVTGQYTVMVLAGCSSVSSGTTVSRVAGTAQIATAVSCTLQVPQGDTYPFEFSAARSSQVNGGVWVSIPWQASDTTSATLAAKTAANLTPGLKCWVESGNEHWNDTTNQYGPLALGYLAGYLPTGTAISNYYTTTNGTFLSLDQFYTLQAARQHDIWYGVFNALGRGGDIVRVFGGQDSNVSHQIQIVQWATQLGIPMDAIAVAPYYQMQSDTPFEAACQPFGYAGTPGGLPVDAIADLVKHVYFYDTTRWTWYAQYLAYAAWGQPVSPLSVGIFATTGGSLAAGGYYVYFTYLDTHGNETTVGNSLSGPIVVTAGDILQATFPALPVWAASANLYLTPANGLPSSQVLYASGITASTYNLSSATWANSSKSPPTTNQVPQTHGAPMIVAYECAAEQLLPGGLPFQSQIARDLYSSPGYYDIVTSGVLCGMQAGNPAITGSGLAVACYFQLCAPWSADGGVWSLAISTSQVAGDGTANQYATLQGGFPADNLSHDYANQAVGIWALRNWVQGSSPPAPAIVSTVPSAFATVVAANLIVGATFSEAIAPNTLAFTIAPTAGGANVPGAISLDHTATMASFFLRAPLAYSTGYTATILATGSDGTPMPAVYQWSWTTSDAPPNGTWGIPSVDFVFGSAIVSGGLAITATVGGISFPGTTTYSSGTLTATFTPTTPFVGGTKYLLTIAGATAADGTPMASQTIAFTPSAAAPPKGWYGGLGKRTLGP